MKGFKTMAMVAATVAAMGLLFGSLPVQARGARPGQPAVQGDNVAKSPLQKPPRAPRGAKKAPEGKISLNSATLPQLCQLPRIGTKVAQRILDYREAHKGFKTVEELRHVKGVGPKILENLRPYLTL